MRFYKDKQGLPYINLEESEQDTVMMLVQEYGATSKAVQTEGTNLIQTIQGNYEGYTKKETLRAREARRAQTMLWSPTKKDFKGMVSSNIIPNCPISGSNITNAQNIFGPDLASVRRKTVHQTPAPVVGDYVAIPHKLVKANAAVTLVAIVFFVDGAAFLVKNLRKIK